MVLPQDGGIGGVKVTIMKPIEEDDEVVGEGAPLPF